MRDLLATAIALIATAAAFALGAMDTLNHLGMEGNASSWQAAAVLLLFAGLVYGSIVYLLSRLGQLLRQRHFERTPSAMAERIDPTHLSSVCVLIPSYREELRVIRQTILSAALCEYPSRRLVLLIDDPCEGPQADHRALFETRCLVADLHNRFHGASLPYKAELAAALERASGSIDAGKEARRLASLYRKLAAWVEQLAEAGSDPAFAHVDAFFNDRIIGAAAASHRLRATQLLATVATDAQILLSEYRRLAALLDVPIDSFERKRYVNLSHSPSKAMNLNSYIGLLGRTLRTVEGTDGRRLLDCSELEADVVIPATDYLLTLDADSVVRHDYLPKLVAVLDADTRLAVAQTPYSTHPAAPGLLERCAGAQTDLQYLVHQGFTYFGATYWVGANALLRTEALRDIRYTTVERGFKVPVFIQDKTVIEDTGSTLDLVRQGWRLYNHPERLAYSATPPDFGALVIQRRRWANGGLIILADLLRYVCRPLGPRPGASELLIRAHYLLSPTLSSVGVGLLALLPLSPALFSPWHALMALPYLLVYGHDLARCGYGWRDVGRVYALNLMLIPVNAAGVLHSVRQIVLGRKSAFARTPKVGRRTAAPGWHIATQLMLPVLAVIGVVISARAHQPVLACFAALNAVALGYGFVSFIGIREAREDLQLAFGAWRRKVGEIEQSPAATPSAHAAAGGVALPMFGTSKHAE
jgi:cellulose synthase (UDP-forming)